MGDQVDQQHVRLKRVEFEISELRSHTERIPALETALSHLQSTLNRLVERENKPFPIWNLVSAVGVMAVILAGYATLITRPLSDISERNYSAIEELQLNRERTAKLEADIEWLQREAALQRQFNSNATFNLGRWESLEETVRDIDRFGSRHWVAKPEDIPK